VIFPVSVMLSWGFGVTSNECIYTELRDEGQVDSSNCPCMQAVETNIHMQGVEWVVIGGYSHGSNIKSQLAICFLIVSDVWKNNSPFPEIRLWLRTPRWQRLVNYGLQSDFISPRADWCWQLWRGTFLSWCAQHTHTITRMTRIHFCLLILSV
jgi:hypothetical protein